MKCLLHLNRLMTIQRLQCLPTRHFFLTALGKSPRFSVSFQESHKLSIIRAEEMNRIKYFRDVKVRPILIQLLNLGIIISSALMLWKGLMCITGCQSPVVVVLTGSMEPGFKRGDILFLHMNVEPIRAGEIVVYNVDGRDIPIVHRVIKVHERHGTGEVDILTKGDNNLVDDISLYSEGRLWLNRHHIIGRAKGYLPYVGYITIIMTETPIIKYMLIALLALLSVTSKD